MPYHAFSTFTSSRGSTVEIFEFQSRYQIQVQDLFHYLLILFLDKDSLLECSYYAKITNLFFFQLHQPNYLICLTPLLKLHIIFTIHIFAVIHIRSVTQPMVRLARF